MIELFYDLGIRQTLIAFNKQNSAGGGCADGEDRGLTPYGRQLVTEMQRVGMLLDLSHTGHRTSLDAMAVASKPCCSVIRMPSLSALPSAISRMINPRLRRTGGVVGVSGSSEYLGDAACSNDTLFRHIDYMGKWPASTMSASVSTWYSSPRLSRIGFAAGPMNGRWRKIPAGVDLLRVARAIAGTD